MKKSIIAITMGDASGIGPEVIVKALGQPTMYETCIPVVVGSESVLRHTIQMVKSPAQLNPVSSVSEAKGQFGTIDLLDLNNLDISDVVTGKVTEACGKAAMEYIDKAARLAIDGDVRAMVTAPINKEATKQAGYGDVGHLEFLARLTAADEYATMLTTGPLRVVHLTTHFSLRDACDQVTRDNILGKLKLTHQSFEKWGFDHPSIAVAALNPHGSEGGLFGHEENEHIIPAVEGAIKLGIDARGPFPADSVFVRAIHGEFDVVLAMFHDQGHIPIKVHGFENSVSVALGLPFVRTSVDHGTAFEIAGKGIADSQSLVEAFKTAVSLIEEKRLSKS
ncbi:4-hydroxythreonine-4-phosphate dehydrogenase PdxA [Chloroflexota bacterium]